MKKNALAIFLALTVLFSNICSALALTLEYDGGQHEYTGALYTLYVSGKKIETPLAPIIFNDRAVVPVREVFEALGAEVGYEQATKKITVRMDSDTVVLTINQNTALVNGKSVSIPDGVTPKLIAKKGESAKTMVPVRFVSEELGLKVGFNNEQKAISVSFPAPEIKLTDVNTKKTDGGVTITVKADKAIEKISKPVLTSENVLYADISNADYTTENSYTINAGGVKSIRFGRHNGYSRIAVDLVNYQSYSMQLSEDKKNVVITVTAQAGQASTSPATPTPTSTSKPSVSTPNPDNKEKKIVVIDAGHGGSDPGASGTYNGKKYNEKDLTLSVAKKVQSILTSKGIPVVMTRTGDIYPTLDERPALANQQNAALFVSIHINSVDNAPGASGAEVYYSSSNNDDDYGVTSKELAQSLLSEVLKLTGQKSRGVKTESHVVTRKCDMPAALYEIGFITNAEEIEKMISDDFQQKVAQGLANGIIKVWNKVTIPEKTTQTTEVSE